jgi:hypothetical protein
MAKSDYNFAFAIGSITRKSDGSVQVEGVKTDPNRPVEEELALIDRVMQHLKDMSPAAPPSGPVVPAMLPVPVPAVEQAAISPTISAAIKEYIVEVQLNNA